MKNSTQKLNRIAATSIFAAIAYLSMFLTPFRVDFLTFDIKDAVMTIGALYLGPLAGLAMSAVTSLLEMFTISQTGIDGMIMNFVGSATYTVVAALIYTYRKSLKNAVLGLVAATLSMTAVMLAANLIITPGFKGVPVEAVIAMIPTLLLPFNLLKGILNAALVMLLYKPVVAFMKKREDHFADLEKQAQEAKSQAEATLAEYNAKLAGADEEIRQKNAAAAQEADRQRQERMQRAQADADKLLKSARGAAEQERNAMLEGAKKDIAQMVVSATGKLMDKENDPAFDKALYDSFLKAAQEENDHD